MIKNYFKIAWRNLLKSKWYSLINIGGLAVGLAVAILIGLWIHEELTFDRQYKNYDRIAQVMQNQTYNGETGSQTAVPYLMGEELKKDYANDFKQVTMASWTYDHILSSGEKKLTKSGIFFEPPAIEMLSLKMLKGSAASLNDSKSVILSATTAKAIFGEADPVNKIMKIDNRFDVIVTGVYKDLPDNSTYNKLAFIAPWKLYIDSSQWSEKLSNPWRNNSFQTYVQLADNADMAKVSAKNKRCKT